MCLRVEATCFAKHCASYRIHPATRPNCHRQRRQYLAHVTAQGAVESPHGHAYPIEKTMPVIRQNQRSYSSHVQEKTMPLPHQNHGSNSRHIYHTVADASPRQRSSLPTAARTHHDPTLFADRTTSVAFPDDARMRVSVPGKRGAREWRVASSGAERAVGHKAASTRRWGSKETSFVF